jgi:hypothetical protein
MSCGDTNGQVVDHQYNQPYASKKRVNNSTMHVTLNPVNNVMLHPQDPETSMAEPTIYGRET